MIPGMNEANASPSGSITIRLRHVLVVDEAVPIQRKLLDILHRSGIATTEITMCSTTDDALEAFALKHPTLVFCELVGEPSRGLGMVLEMLAIDPQAKIVLVTAEDPAAPVVRSAIRAGAFGVVRKPLRFESIRGVLAEIENEEGGVERYR